MEKDAAPSQHREDNHLDMHIREYLTLRRIGGTRNETFRNMKDMNDLPRPGAGSRGRRLRGGADIIVVPREEPAYRGEHR